MKQQILDMERELTKSVKDQEENLATIEDIKSKLASSSSELLSGRRRVGQLQTSYGRCAFAPPGPVRIHFFCRLLKELEALQPVLGDIKQLKEVGNGMMLLQKVCQHQFEPRWQLDCVLAILPLVPDRRSRSETKQSDQALAYNNSWISLNEMWEFRSRRMTHARKRLLARKSS